jgi:hypothetical protein
MIAFDADVLTEVLLGDPTFVARTVTVPLIPLLGRGKTTKCSTRRYSIMVDALIRTATAADAERCLAVLAFSSDPPCRWAWPDLQQYLEAFPRFARAFGGGAIEHGTANYYEDFSGVALWLPPSVAPDDASLVRVI